jgi:hypothetical protein
MRTNREYNLYKAIATYLRYQYPNVLYHFDITGCNLSIAQAGMNKAIQHGRGFPDLVILQNNIYYHGLFLEIKPEGTKLYKKSGEFTSEHIAEQYSCIVDLRARGYAADFVVGFDDAKTIIDSYLKK